MEYIMNIFKKKDKVTNTITTDGESNNDVMYSYMIYCREDNSMMGAIKLTEEQATSLNAFFKAFDIDNKISFVRS